jgi:UDP-3-O-[3-hydroxymyristoyl] glucosamine N-acyltransferase
MVEMTLEEIARLVDGKLHGDGARAVRGVAGIHSAQPDELTFLANRRYERYIASTQAAGVLVRADYAGPGESLIRCEDPYFAFREAMVAFYGFRRSHFEGVDARACVDPTAELGDGVRVGPLATIGPGCRIGAGTEIHPGTHVGPYCEIGRDCILYPNVTLYDGTKLGDRVTIHAGSSIGQDGFGYATHAGRHEKIPQAGRVRVEDDVEIGACCTIDRATMGDTVLGAGTKMSNLVAIGHGTHLGKHCLLVAQAGIAGSTEVGDYCVFAGQAGVVGHIRIGDGARIAAKSGVNGDVPAGQEVLGIPAIPLAEARRAMMSFSRLPQLRTAVRKLTRELNTLKRELGRGDAPSEEDA